MIRHAGCVTSQAESLSVSVWLSLGEGWPGWSGVTPEFDVPKTSALVSKALGKLLYRGPRGSGYGFMPRRVECEGAARQTGASEGPGRGCSGAGGQG